MGLNKCWLLFFAVSFVCCYEDSYARNLEAEEEQEREYYEKHRDYFLEHPNDRSDHFLRPKPTPTSPPDPHTFNSVVGTNEEQQERDYYERNRDYYLKNPNERSDLFLRPENPKHSGPQDTHNSNIVENSNEQNERKYYERNRDYYLKNPNERSGLFLTPENPKHSGPQDTHNSNTVENSNEQNERKYYERNRDYYLKNPNERSDLFLRPDKASSVDQDRHSQNSAGDTTAHTAEQQEREYYERNRDYFLENPTERSDYFLRPDKTTHSGPPEPHAAGPLLTSRHDLNYDQHPTDHPTETDSYDRYYEDYYKTTTPQPRGSFDAHRQGEEPHQPYDPYKRWEAPPNFGQPHDNRLDPYRPDDRNAQPHREDFDRRPQPQDNRVTHARLQPQSAPRVNIPGQGSVFGATAFSAWTGRPFSKFLGIKYAHVGKGEKRFQKAEEPRPWAGEFDATKEPLSCPSFPNLNKVRLEERHQDLEDCLTVSIYTPDVHGRFPVMFYIHGEFFFDGTSQEAQPDYLLEKNVVLVAVEYRLAPFGFLALPNEKIPGNAAVTDVIAALKWVQKYIRYFGGDPRRVTLVGQGAGASMAHLLSITPYVESNLFHQVILQSGTALNPYLLTNTPAKHTTDIAKKAGCLTDSNDAISDCLTTLSTSQILQAFLKHCQENESQGVGHYGGFQFTIGDFYGIIPKHPFDLARDYDGENYLILGGVTSRVGSFYYSKIYSYIQRSPRKDLDVLIDIVLKHTVGKEDDSGIWENLITSQLVSDEERRRGTPEETSKTLIDLVSNILYKAPLLEALQQNAKFDPNGTYLYSFDYEGTHKRYRFAPFPFDMGVTLSDDNIYLYPYPEYVAPLDDNDEKVAHIMVDLWTSFATTGVPQSPSVKDWPQMHMITGPYLSIDQHPEVNDDFVHEFSEYLSSSKVFNAAMEVVRASAGKNMFSK